jgi:Cu-Zn family superoxide dismutase
LKLKGMKTMKNLMMRLVCLSAVGLVVSGCSDDETAAAGGGASATIAESTTISNPGADLAGTGTFAAAASMVTLTINLTDCPEGDHGVHIHAGTACGTDGSDAMGHWDPLAVDEHGQVGEAAPHHAGDVGVVSCDENGAGTLTISTDEWSLTAGETNNPTGQAVIVHGVDSKQRIGCGMIDATGNLTVAATTLTANPAAGIAGTVAFSQVSSDGPVTVDVALTGCPAGSHGFHIHAGTSCGADGKEAMGHWDPQGIDTHGQVGEAGAHHAGDVGAVTCDDAGDGTLSLTTDEWTLSGSGDNPVGQAMILHGIDAANRVACGIVSAD